MNAALRAMPWIFAALAAAAVALDLADAPIPFALWIAIGTWTFVCGAVAVARRHLASYVAWRALEAAFTVLTVATLTFVLMRFLPGGPFDQERAMLPEIRANVEAKYGLDRPLAEQYLRYLAGAARGDLGPSYKYDGRGVSEILAQSLPPTLQLGFYALLFAFVVGAPLGLSPAVRRDTKWDRVATLLSIAGVALPSFFVGPLLVQAFSFGVPFSALRGALPPALWEGPAYYVLPVVTLGLRPMAVIARLVRASALEIMDLDFIRTARAKGLAERAVIFKHVLRNSLIPMLAVSGPLVAGVLSGSFVVELIFAVPGVGKHLVQSVANRDYPLVLGATLVYAAMLVVANLIVDVLCALADPRIELA